MKSELLKKLYDKHEIVRKNLDRNVTPQSQNNFMRFGLQCGRGWFDIIDELLGAIGKITTDINIQQIKQKMGGLHFYYNVEGKHVETIDALISLAEDKASVTCEFCGKAGEFRCADYWYYVSCDEHKKDINNDDIVPRL